MEPTTLTAALDELHRVQQQRTSLLRRLRAVLNSLGKPEHPLLLEYAVKLATWYAEEVYEKDYKSRAES